MIWYENSSDLSSHIFRQWSSRRFATSADWPIYTISCDPASARRYRPAPAGTTRTFSATSGSWSVHASPIQVLSPGFPIASSGAMSGPPAGLSFWSSASLPPRRPSFRFVDFRYRRWKRLKLQSVDPPLSCRYLESRKFSVPLQPESRPSRQPRMNRILY
jgi:hypothetical protein